jgi:hypothetical protein
LAFHYAFLQMGFYQWDMPTSMAFQASLLPNFVEYFTQSPP